VFVSFISSSFAFSFSSSSLLPSSRFVLAVSARVSYSARRRRFSDALDGLRVLKPSRERYFVANERAHENDGVQKPLTRRRSLKALMPTYLSDPSSLFWCLKRRPGAHTRRRFVYIMNGASVRFSSRSSLIQA